MKKMKTLCAVILALAMVLAMSGCQQETQSTSSVAPAQKTQVRVMALKGPTGMGMAKLMNDQEQGTTANEYSFSVADAPDAVSAEVIKGSVDIAAVPTNLASVLYAKTKGEVQVVALNTLGVLYLLENGNTIQSISDLKGKTIYASGQGATPEYVLRYLLEKNNIDPDKDVTIEYKAEHSELATLMTAGEVVLGVLPEPNVTAVLSGNSDVRIALNLTEEWNKVAEDNSVLTMGCLVVRKEFAEQNKEALDQFLTEYQSSVEYVNANVTEASELIAAQGIIPKAAVAAKALPNCNICYIDGEQMKTQLSGFLKVLYEANPNSVGGNLPDENFYYQK